MRLRLGSLILSCVCVIPGASSAATLTIAPQNVHLTAGQAQQFTANHACSWSTTLGSIQADGLYRAPTVVTSPQVATISCAAPGGSPASVVLYLDPIAVSIAPDTITVPAGTIARFTASIARGIGTGTPANSAVTWTLTPALGSLSTAGVYTAPSSVATQQNVTITAISINDTSKKASASVWVVPAVGVTVTAGANSVAAGGSVQFSASVTGTTNTAVSWSLDPAVGSISASGLYTAPTTIPGQQAVSAIATSAADRTKSAAATILIVPATSISVSVSPSYASIQPGQTVQFSASVSNTSNTGVTWAVNGIAGGSAAVGTISAAGMYTAPSVAPPAAVAIAAISVADATKSGNAKVSIVPPVTVPIRTFTITEQFGVSHPKQVIDFDYSAPVDITNTYMIGPDGAEVPYQVLSNGNIAVQTDLPANATKSWTLYSGHAPKQFTGLVTMSPQSGYYELSNGLTGVRVLRTGPGTDTRLSPIQGIQLRDASWTAVGPNYIFDLARQGWAAPSASPPQSAPLIAANTVDTQIIEQGSLEVIIKVRYTYTRISETYFGTTIPGGPGSHTVTIAFYAGQPSIMIEDDTDTELRFALDFSSALLFNEARYRGHTADDLHAGRMPSGGLYASDPSTVTVDAYRNFQYNVPGLSTWTSVFTPSYTYELIKRLESWDPWAVDSGWYWMAYDNTAPPNAPVLGLFAGRASEALGTCNTGPGIYTAPVGMNGRPASGFVFEADFNCNPTFWPHMRFSWGLFVGTKGADLGDPYQVQNINRQMNLFGGMNLNKVYRYSTPYPDPPNGYPSLFITGQEQAALINRVQTDYAFYQYLYSAEPTARVLLDAWRDTSGAKAHALVVSIIQATHNMLDALVNGEGIYSQYGYWKGGELASSQQLFIQALLAGNQISQNDRIQLKAAAALFANILWDNDFAPLQDGTSLNLGTANMPVQQANFRNTYALMLPFLPGMQANAAGAGQSALTMLDTQVNSYGAQRDSPHYAAPAMGPLLNTLQELKVNSSSDPFKTAPKLAAFAEFYMNMLTPPEPRFGGVRKLVSLGDGATESGSAFLLGQMATGFANVNTDLSGRLMDAWNKTGSPEDGYVAGTTVLKIDHQLPSVPMTLNSANFPGYCSILRNDFGTPNESAIWLVNGGFYSDHRHDDNGSISIYALDSPLSIDWGSMYYPAASGIYAHSTVVPETQLLQLWDSVSPALVDPVSEVLWQSVGGSFAGFGNSTQAGAVFSTMNNDTGWSRTVTSIHPNPAYPVILIQDSFTGPASGARKVFSLNLMAQGPVTTPAGPVTPAPALYSWYGSLKQLPSATPAQALAPGMNKFHFTGQWNVDWDLYTLTSESQLFSLGSWGHDWAPTTELSQFLTANGKYFQETQDIFRIDGTGAFTVALLPAFKGAQRPHLTVTSNNGALPLNITDPDSGEQTIVDPTGFAFHNSQETILTSFSASPVSELGISVTGGPTEIVIQGGHVTITASGAAGTRNITLPGNWTPVAPLSFANGVYTLNYAGGAPLTVVL